MALPSDRLYSTVCYRNSSSEHVTFVFKLGQLIARRTPAEVYLYWKEDKAETAECIQHR